MESNKEITMDGLARMVQKGFDGVDVRLDKVDTDLTDIKGRLSRIEKLLIEEHRRRIEKLENDVSTLKEALNIK